MRPESPSMPPHARVGAAGAPAVVASCAVLAFTAACLAHEALGHAGACLAGGGTVTALTSSLFACHPGTLLADLGGPAANLLVGLAALRLLRGARPGTIGHLALLLLAAFDLFWLAGCLLQSAVASRGDFAYAQRLAGDAQVPLRVAFGVVAVGLGAATCRLLGRQHLTRTTYQLAYAAAGAAACLSALFNARLLGPALHEAALESLGAMAWLWLVRPRPVGPPPEPAASGPGSRRVVALALLALVLLFALGHGIDAAPAGGAPLFGDAGPVGRVTAAG